MRATIGRTSLPQHSSSLQPQPRQERYRLALQPTLPQLLHQRGAMARHLQRMAIVHLMSTTEVLRSSWEGGGSRAHE